MSYSGCAPIGNATVRELVPGLDGEVCVRSQNPMVALCPEFAILYNGTIGSSEPLTRAARCQSTSELIAKFGRNNAMNRPRAVLMPCAIAVFLAALLPLPAAAGIKCWTNNEGVRECGNAVPPEFAQKGHQEVTEMGVTVSKTDPALSKDELRIQREEGARAAAIRAEEAHRIRKRKSKDRVLLSTFTTEEELAIAHEGQVTAIDIRIGHTEKILVQLEQSLKLLRAQAAKLERGGKPITPEIKDRIAKVGQQLKDRDSFIKNRRLQKAVLAAQFTEDLDRYRELKGTTKKAN